jgi:hypothetical protein
MDLWSGDLATRRRVLGDPESTGDGTDGRVLNVVGPIPLSAAARWRRPPIATILEMYHTRCLSAPLCSGNLELLPGTSTSTLC